jgi:hypothetical protein
MSRMVELEEGIEPHFKTVFLKRRLPVGERVEELMEWGKRYSTMSAILC